MSFLLKANFLKTDVYLSFAQTEGKDSKGYFFEDHFFNLRMHNMSQNDPDDAAHVDCLKRFVNFFTLFLDSVSNLLLNIKKQTVAQSYFHFF